MLQPGQTFAHFNIIRLLGEGGMGQVYLAEDQKLHRQVALKVLTWQHGDDEERAERFQREAKTAAQISHPNVMAIYDIDSATDASGRDVTYIVMEYVKGKPLGEYIRTRHTDTAAVVRLAEKIATGLAAAHKMSVVHRDIKADNILVDDDDEPKILDFGLAKPLDPVQFTGGEPGTKTISKELTRAGKIVGTVAYMSPEQVRGEQVDTRSDIFSFGVLLYRMATGELPFAAPTEVSTLAKILEGRHEPLRIKNESIPQELERIVDKCLQKNASDRYQDTRDLVVDLRNLRRQFDSGASDRISAVTDRPTQSPQAAPAGKPWYTNLGRRPTMLVVLCLLITYMLISKMISRGGSEGSSSLQAKPNSLAILEFDNKTGDTTLNWLETGLPEIMLTDLAQHQGINLISRQRIIDKMQENGTAKDEMSQDTRRKVATGLGASTVLSGAFYKVGNKIRIDARLEDATSGRIMLGEKVVGEDPFALVDSLTDKVASSMNATLASSSDNDVRNMTSSNPDAYKQYILGMDKFGLGLYNEAIPLFQKAISLDSTFALPYMRIGMAHAFQQHPQEAGRYIAKALKWQSHLPARERTLLDIYSDIWLQKKFDDAFAKMRGMVSSYPDDIEARTIYGILINEFTHDTVAAFAQIDSAVQLNPNYLFALEYKAEQYLEMGQFDHAIAVVNQVKQSHPDAPSVYSISALAYLKQGKRDQAASEYEALLQKYPENTNALMSLYRLAIYRRDFPTARTYLDKTAEIQTNNLYNRIDYYAGLANLENWQGRFRPALKFMEDGLQVAKKIGDSSILCSAYQDAAAAYMNVDMNDSGLALYKSGFAVHTANMFPQYPIALVAVDRKNANVARPIFKGQAAALKSRIPAELWGIPDGIDSLFEGICTSDTGRMISGLRMVIEAQGNNDKGDMRELAQFLILTGKYDEGVKILEGFVAGDDESTNGWSYHIMLYHLGMAYEGLGQRDKAANAYRKMLADWSNADMQIKEITDAKARLAKLTS